MSAIANQTKTLTTLDLSIRTLKPSRAVSATDASEKQSARVVVVTSF